jgi:serine/threonine protein kinase
MARSLRKGKHFGDWQLVSFLGEGGNGFVWQASNSNGETAAIKILAKLEQKSRSKTYERFKHEVKVVQANSDIEGILPILDSYLPSELGDDLAWYVMPAAQPLEEYLANRSFVSAIEAVLSVGKLVCALHKREISHRDIKPANILARDQKFYLSDFGLVDFPEKPDFTVQGERIGALPTIAPEMKFSADKADGKPADVYSLAKTLWILLTGRSYGFEGQYDPNSINGLGRLNLTEPERPGIRFSNPPSLYLGPLDHLLRASTNDDPSLRPTIDEFLEQLSSWTEIFKDFRKRVLSNGRTFRKSCFHSVCHNGLSGRIAERLLTYLPH